MPTEQEIIDGHKALHDDLSNSYYSGESELTKEEFDQQHNQIWIDMKQELLDNGYLTLPEPPRSTHVSVLEAIDIFKARPARIKRVWENRDYFYDCFVTQNVKDEYQAEKIIMGDYVLVHFDAIGEQVITAKVFKTW